MNSENTLALSLIWQYAICGEYALFPKIAWQIRYYWIRMRFPFFHFIFVTFSYYNLVADSSTETI